MNYTFDDLDDPPKSPTESIDRHALLVKEYVNILEMNGYSVKKEYSVRLSSGKLYRMDVAGFRHNYTVFVECGRTPYNKPIDIISEQLCDEFIHTSYEDYGRIMCYDATNLFLKNGFVLEQSEFRIESEEHYLPTKSTTEKARIHEDSVFITKQLCERHLILDENNKLLRCFTKFGVVIGSNKNIRDKLNYVSKENEFLTCVETNITKNFHDKIKVEASICGVSNRFMDIYFTIDGVLKGKYDGSIGVNFQLKFRNSDELERFLLDFDKNFINLLHNKKDKTKDFCDEIKRLYQQEHDTHEGIRTLKNKKRDEIRDEFENYMKKLIK